ncbi:MAG: 30S ribosomal protein S4 [Candidatus Micrarchaeia archaeon]
MGDPRKLRPKAETPRKVWDSERIKEESGLKREYGLKKTGELWTIAAELKRTRRTARSFLSLGEEGEVRGQKIVAKLKKLGVVKSDIKVEDILALTVRDFLERRLQTLVLKRGLARTPNQARQLVTHGFISVKGRRVNIPSYLVTVDEEPSISYFKAIDISLPDKDAQKESAKKGRAKRTSDSADASAEPAAEAEGAELDVAPVQAKA